MVENLIGTVQLRGRIVILDSFLSPSPSPCSFSSSPPSLLMLLNPSAPESVSSVEYSSALAVETVVLSGWNVNLRMPVQLLLSRPWPVSPWPSPFSTLLGKTTKRTYCKQKGIIEPESLKPQKSVEQIFLFFYPFFSTVKTVSVEVDESSQTKSDFVIFKFLFTVFIITIIIDIVVDSFEISSIRCCLLTSFFFFL